MHNFGGGAAVRTLIKIGLISDTSGVEINISQ